MSRKKGKSYNPRTIPASGIVCACLGVLSLALCSLTIVYTEYRPERVALLYLAIYLGVVTVILTANIIAYALNKRNVYNFTSSVTQGISAQFIQKLTKPVLICDDKGKIVWYNRFLREICRNTRTVYGKYVDSICDSSLEHIINSDSVLGTEVRFFTSENSGVCTNEIYNTVGYEIEQDGKSFSMVVFTNITKMKTLEKRLRDEETIIAYAIIDNLEELLQYIQEGYGNASEAVEKILEKYFQDVGGFVREYGNNRFICVFDAKRLDELEEDKFSLLDEIREIRLGESTLSVTISMGIAKTGGTLYEKERATQAALDMALQRGGDQVVIKTKEGAEFYGGKTKAIQKRTKVRSRVIANQLISLISRSSGVIAMGHKFPDADSLASCVALSRIAKFCGTPVHIVVNQNDTNLRNCFLSLADNPEYSGLFIDRAQAQDLMESDTLVVVTDVNNINICESPEIVANAQDIAIIDHHRKTSDYVKKPSINYIEPSASSASELMAELMEHILPQGSLAKPEADLLFAGILLDTKNFTHNTGVRTFSAALYLRNEGASPLDAQALFKTNLEDFLSEAKFESNVEIHRNIVAIAKNEVDSDDNINRVNASKAADRLLSVDGISAAFALCSVDGVICISARSDGTINVQRIAEKLGGGGHFDSAGAQMRDVTMKDAEIILRQTIDEILDGTEE